MKIFISHSSKNATYGQAIVDLLVAVGVNSEQIIFTSNDAFGIPTGQNIFNWLKARITEKPHVVYLLSTAYYSSIACLNEMGAAWVVENEHTMIFTPEFNTSSYEFQNGALDPREMGFKINNHDRVVEFIETLRGSFPISTKAVLVGQKIREFIEKVNSFQVPNETLPINKSIVEEPKALNDLINKNQIKVTQEKQIVEKPVKEIAQKTPQKNPDDSIGNLPQVIKFFNDLQRNKLKDEEILLLHYASDTARFKLGTGWKSGSEIENIKTWEDVNDLNSKLSLGYDEIIRRFDLKKLTEVTELTSSGNPREIMLISDLQNILLEIPKEVNLKIEEVLARNEKTVSTWDKEDSLPF